MVITVLLALSFSAFLFARASESEAAEAVIMVAGNQYMTVRLDEPGVYEITDGHFHNTAVVENGAIRITDADCPDKTCIKTGKIYLTNQSIACLPNRVFISVTAGGDAEIDSISR